MFLESRAPPGHGGLGEKETTRLCLHRSTNIARSLGFHRAGPEFMPERSAGSTARWRGSYGYDNDKGAIIRARSSIQITGGVNRVGFSPRHLRNDGGFIAEVGFRLSAYEQSRMSTELKVETPASRTGKQLS